MYSYEDRRRAVELYIKYGRRAMTEDVISDAKAAELLGISLRELNARLQGVG